MRIPAAVQRPTTAALIAVNLAIAAVLVHQLWGGTQTASLLATPVHPVMLPSPNIKSPARVANLAVLQDRPLLYTTRQFYVPPPVSTVAKAPPPPEYRLQGIFMIPHKPSVALLSSPTGVTRKVVTGDSLEGWQVQSIDSLRVILQYQSQTKELTSTARGTRSSGTSSGLQRVSGSLAPHSTPGGIRTLSGDRSQVSASPIAQSNVSPRLFHPPPPPQ